MRGPTQRSISQGGDPAGLEFLGPVGSRLPSPGAKRWGGPTSTTWHRPRSGSLKTRPIKSVPSRVGEGREAEGSEVGGGGRSDAAK